MSSKGHDGELGPPGECGPGPGQRGIDLNEIVKAIVNDGYLYGSYDRGETRVSAFISGIRKTVQDEIEIEMGREDWIGTDQLIDTWRNDEKDNEKIQNWTKYVDENGKSEFPIKPVDIGGE